MKKKVHLVHKFVKHIPEVIEDGTVYVSIEFATVVHKCCCGCGYEVVTPLSPTDWQLIFDGQSISLEPSIGNWNMPCQSHYWIKNDNVKWARRWTRMEIDAGRDLDTKEKERYFGTVRDEKGNAKKFGKHGQQESLTQKKKGHL